MVDSTVMQSGRYKAYPEYKDSGVEWLGEIPRHWGLLRGKWRFKSLKEVNRNLQCMDRLALTMRGVIERSIDSDDGLQPSAFTGYQIFEKDDLVFKLIDLENYKTSRVGLVFKKGIMSPAYIRLKPNKGMSSKFFYYFYFDLYLRGIYNQIGGQGVRSALNASDLLEIEICVPSREEQAEIANFLDHEIEKISTLIEKQQHLIELLTEKRQAVISHAVTKGLNPDVPMKDSGVEWLGEVPEHWKVMQFRRITSLSQGLQIPQSERLYEPRDNTVEYITIKSIHAGEALENREYIYKPSTRVQCDYDDVLLARTGATGEVISGVKGAFHNNFFKVSYSDRVTKDFLVNLLTVKELKSHLLMLAGTTTIPDLNHGAFLSTKIALPSLDEQKAICDEILRQSTKFDKLLNVAHQAIQLMQERRTALISAAVTGKIDVRDWVKPE